MFVFEVVGNWFYFKFFRLCIIVGSLWFMGCYFLCWLKWLGFFGIRMIVGLLKSNVWVLNYVNEYVCDR